MEAKHTPTPWAREGRLIGGADRVRVADCHVGERDTYQNLANANLIVRSVNSHAALVDALRSVVSAADDMGVVPNWHDSMDKARAALALAEEL